MRTGRLITFADVGDGAKRLDTRPGYQARISVVLWDRGPDVDASPAFVELDGQVVTMVAVWPTSAGGALDVRRLDELEVLPWSLEPKTFERLRAVHAAFHLGRHDLFLEGTRDGVLVWPLEGSLYRQALHGTGEVAAVIADRVRDTIARWRGAA